MNIREKKAQVNEWLPVSCEAGNHVVCELLIPSCCSPVRTTAFPHRDSKYPLTARRANELNEMASRSARRRTQPQIIAEVGSSTHRPVARDHRGMAPFFGIRPYLSSPALRSSRSKALRSVRWRDAVMPRPFASLDAKLLGQSNLPFVFLLDVFVETCARSSMSSNCGCLRPQINHLSLQIFSSGTENPKFSGFYSIRNDSWTWIMLPMPLSTNTKGL